MITNDTISIGHDEALSAKSKLEFKSILIKKAKDAGWPVLLSTSCEIKLPKGFELIKSDDFLSMVATYRIKEIK